VNHTKIFDELNEHWEVLAEAIQTVLRRENYPNPYEKLKELTRKGSSIQEQDIKEFIQTLEIKDTVKQELLLLTPHNYIGIHPWNK
jgi:adenylosuccinate lyase